jgi:transcription antitermination protein NusB
MGLRRKARELAMQTLFCMDMVENKSEELVERLSEVVESSPDIRPFCDMLVKGVVKNKTAIDQVIEQFSDNWKLFRMACVDRNILRIAVFEMLHCDDIPPRVTINEAVDIGKKYGTEDSGAFINGILDSIYQKFAPLPSEKKLEIGSPDSSPK